MFDKNTEQDTQHEPWTIQGLDFDAKENLVGFYRLLLKVDMRNNPQLYTRLKNRQNSSLC